MMEPKGGPSERDIAAVIEIAAGEGANATYRAVDALARRTIGHILFTVNRHLPATAEVERLYSSDPAAYPVGGRKQKRDTPWGRIVLDQGEVFIAHDGEHVRAAFSDHELIASLGIAAIMNVPIRFCGQTLGAMNLCGEAGRYTEADIPAAKLIAGLLVPAVMADTIP
jgi:GAF domain-containing protein